MKKFVILFLSILLSLSVFSQENILEVFSWWTGGGEAEGLQALFNLFHKYYPDIKIINAAVAGGAGTNAKAVLKTRMLGKNPPDSFQVHAGMELTDTYVIPGLMEPITWILKEIGAYDKFPKDLIDIVSYKGEIYSVPVNVHRANVVFYNKEIAKKIGMKKAPTTWPELLAYLDKAQKMGYVGISLGDKNKWTSLHLFESIMLSQLGPEKYNNLWKGKASFNDPDIRQALLIFKDVLKYVNSDHSALTWQDATRMLFEGKAFCNMMGDWAEGYLKTLNWKPGEDFGWFALPGTQNAFMLVSDTFGLPKNAPHRENAIKWIKLLASVEAQDTFNPIKGSIPARIDADKSKYDVYLKWSMDDFSTKAITPSIIHGSAAPEAFVTALMDAINIFVTKQNVEKTFKEILWIAEDNGYVTD
ncbi:ABC transporter substrate-binding protein [Thermosipho sp. 1063]|uniref:ABC transporter substrate-binding protein n=1 Tax=unclassified Thermosipho (in: thermotogales) TaxID=2676525 RepID=UPI0009493684|nr:MULTISPECIES: extracellular solute-binding protein [unclassified Thermosipho (in: thermotogales)]ANQ53784.1 ABC transporter substrate-binding protein [Thermosipho sp. 1070]APT72230.1 ABC transporter substrate-binding protein [Thermosipho sp. 1063]